MAYENMTYEVILKRMMDRVTAEYPNLDRREGSIIFNALAPAAVELAILYTEIDNATKQSFVSTASRDYIFIACEQMGMNIEQFNASAGVHKGEFNVEVELGSRWSCDLYNYTVTEFLGMNGNYYTYQMNCDTVGTAPNNQTGDLTPITDAPNGLSYAKVTECLIEGENEKSDEYIKTAYFEFVNDTISDGNVAQYKKWANEFPNGGIGKCKVIPLWNGANTVKVSILTPSGEKAGDTLIAEFQEYLDPGVKGMGDGVAPIGAFVTVDTATELPINVSGTVTMKANYTDTTKIDTAIRNYLAEIAYEKDKVSYMNIGAVILGVEGVESLGNDLKINGGTADIKLEREVIPTFGVGNWTVV